MTREEALNILHNPSVYHPMYLDALNMAIKALEQEPCTDAISRAEVLSHAKTEWGNGHEQPFDYVEVDVIKQLPPVTPQYTDTEIQKMQDLEFAEIQKAYEIGKEEGSEVLDKIRAEMEQIKEAEYQIYGKGSWRFVDKCLEIIDKYKASPTGEEVQDANSD